VGLVYDPRELTGVTTVRLRVAGVLQIVLEPTLAVLQARTGQMRRIWRRTGQRREYVLMTCGSSERDTVWYICC
jgi:hypothetical protein